MIGCQQWRPIWFADSAFRKAVFDNDVLALNITEFFQARMERGQEVTVLPWRSRI
jgi:hypothetical protein